MTDIERVAALEGGVGALGLASGQAAETLTVLNLARAGDNLVSSSSLYGGTYNLFAHTLPKLGITTRFVDGTRPTAFGAAIDGRTKAVFAETIGNPRLDVADLAAIAHVAHAAGVPLVVDNTFAPLLARPIEHGADIVIHSLVPSFVSKSLLDHGDRGRHLSLPAQAPPRAAMPHGPRRSAHRGCATVSDGASYASARRPSLRFTTFRSWNSRRRSSSARRVPSGLRNCQKVQPFVCG